MDLTSLGMINSALTERSLDLRGSDHKDALRVKQNEALSQMFTDAPWGFSIDRIMMTVPGDVNSEAISVAGAAVAATCETTTDAWVLELRNATGGLLGPWLPDVTGFWDGLMWIAVYHPTEERWLLFRSRRWYEGTVGVGGVGRYYVSLRTPWPNYASLGAALTGMKFRIFARYVYLPDDVTRIVAQPRVFGDQMRVIRDMSFKDAGIWADTWPDRFANGPPYAYWRAERIRPVASTTYIPTIAAGGGGTFVGPEQEGDFYVKYTVRVGNLNPEFHLSPNSTTLTEPMWESAPSPASSLFSHASGTNAGKALVMTFPDLAAMENFRPAVGTLRSLRIEFRIGVWIARVSTRTAGAGSYNDVPADGVYYLLTELTEGTHTYTWTGATIPNRGVRLRQCSGAYDAYGLWPRPDQDYNIEFQVLRHPAALEMDTDTVPIEPAYGEAFRYLFLSKLCRMDGGDFDAAAEYERLYRAELAKFRSEQSRKANGRKQGMFNGIGVRRGVEVLGTGTGAIVRTT